MKYPTQAVILAGGLGTRMRPFTDAVPKPMISIRGKPFLWYLINLLKENNISEILLLVGYKHHIIKQYFGDGKKFGVSIAYSYSPVEADTGTRIRQARPLLRSRFLLLYGDNYCSLQLNELYSMLMAKRTLGVVTVYANDDNATRNNMRIDKGGYVRVYDRKRTRKNLNAVDIGFFLFHKRAFAKLPKENFSFEDVIIPRLIKAKQLIAHVTHHKYYGLSTPERIPMIEEYFRPKKIVFLDRDGVINEKRPQGEYVTSWSEFSFLPNAIKGLKYLSKKGYELFIVTNQAGIARGKLTWEELHIIHRHMRRELSRHHVRITDIFVCPHGWDDGCPCRKPKPGLFFQAAQRYYLNLRDSYCIGDDVRDIQAGTQAGCKTLLVGGALYRDLYDAAQQL